MPTRVFSLRDDRIHDVRRGLERELCSVDLVAPGTGEAGGPWVVLATGDLHSLEVTFIVQLSVFRFNGPLAASVDYGVWRAGVADVIMSTPLALTLTVELPGESGGGFPTSPPQPRGAVAVAGINGSGAGTVSNLRITAMHLDELHQTHIEAPPPPVIGIEFDMETFSRKARERDDLDE
jgi:hypothetical protein